jgi:hypothetical protein
MYLYVCAHLLVVRRISFVLYCQLLIVVCRRRLLIVSIDYRSL